MNNIRNFCVIAHIDHGKSTLADRFLELTGSIPKNKLQAQHLDRMSLEKERGITIKMHPVKMIYQYENEEYILNLIDTPGHVDFSYEVRRSLNGCEGAILLVDATQGIQAQTLANYYLAKEEGLTVIPVVNKIDLPNAQTEKVRQDLAALTAVPEKEILFVSAKTGNNVEKVLETIIKKIPPPKGDAQQPLRALVFDSLFDKHRGVVAFIRIFDGYLQKGDQIKMLGSGGNTAILETGIFKPDFDSRKILTAGEIGYVVTGFKEVKDCAVGDTIVKISEPAATPLKTYQEPQPMVFAGFYCVDSNDYSKFKEALERLSLNDAAFSFQPENFSSGLGFGFRCGFLGMLHLEITKERLKREYGLNLIVAAPNVSYKIIFNDGTEKIIRSAQEFPDAEPFKEIQEPWLKTEIFAPLKYIGPLMNLIKKFRGNCLQTEHLGEQIRLFCELPLISLLKNFFDELKNASAGYGSLHYQFLGYRQGDLVKMNIRIAGKNIDALSFIITKNEVYNEGKRLTAKLKEILPRQLFEIAIQACIGSQIISRETVPALKKNVTAKLYGGDRSRKTKLWKKQQKGKKKLKEMGTVKIPQEAFFEAIKR